MITEDYVSFETAKFLKEKGFDEPCHCFYEYKKRLYNDMDKYFPNGMKNSDHDKEGNKGVSAPTQAMAMKWLREVHNLFIFPFPQINTNKFWTEIYQLSDNQEWKNIYCESIDLQDYPTYEQAAEAAIKYCLEHLI